MRSLMRTLPGTRTPRNAAFFVAVLLFAVAFTGCASSGQSTEEGEAPAWETVQKSSLHVANRNWMNMMIYAVRGSERFRILFVTSMRTDSVSIPRSLLTGAGFRLMADPVGSVRPYSSSRIFVRRGQTVWWTLENQLVQSSLWIY